MALHVMYDEEAQRCGLCGKYLTYSDTGYAYCRVCGNSPDITLPPYDPTGDWITPDGTIHFTHTSGHNWQYYNYTTGREDVIFEHDLPGNLIPFAEWREALIERTRIANLYGEVSQLSLLSV